MRKFIQPLRFFIQACFMAGLFLPIFPFADSVGQKIWISILFLGVFFCGWMCPFGALQEWVGWCARRVRLPRWRLPQKYQPYAQILRYFLYGLSTLNIVFYFLNSRFYFAHSVSVGMWDWVNGGVLVVFLLLALLLDRPFCNYFCVYGASMGVWSVVRWFGLVRKEETCVHCGQCDQACPMHIAVEGMRGVRHPHCINCLKCVDVCPKQCISFTRMTK